MISFSKIEIKNNVMYISADIGIESYYKDIFIDKIEITDLVTATIAYSSTLDTQVKTIDLEIPSNELLTALDKSLFKVVVTTKGNLKVDVPCGADIPKIEEVLYDKYSRFKFRKFKLNDYLTSTSCDIPTDLIDDILRDKYLDMAIACGDYTNALSLFTDTQRITEIKSTDCGCKNRR